MAFRINGEETGEPITATRLLPASAAVVAMRWVARGVLSVSIETKGSAYPDWLLWRGPPSSYMST
jgi:hypothetical protein